MRELNAWFEKNRRSFPWRENRTPYRVWVSEVMLQQTRAAVVVDYFERWMTLFPSVAALAGAPLELVIKTWEGLGYYSRARNLHKGAQEIVEMFDGEIPQSREALEKISGLGPYTVNAILSFGFKKRTAAVDGNVTRVLARFFSLKENVCKQPAKKKLQLGADAILDSEEPWVSAEALIELGATVCTPKPLCELCPLEKNCLGKSIASSLPVKNPRKEIVRINRTVVILEAEGRVLLKKGASGKIMADLYEFPYFEMGSEIWSRKQINQTIYNTFLIHVEKGQKLPNVSHTFTRYKAELYPFKFEIAKVIPVHEHVWIEKERLIDLPFSSGHRRILQL